MKIWLGALLLVVCGCTGKSLSGTYQLSSPGNRLQIKLIFDEAGGFKEITNISNVKSGEGTEVNGRYSIRGENVILEYPKETAGDLDTDERERKLTILENGRILQVPNNARMRYEKSN